MHLLSDMHRRLAGRRLLDRVGVSSPGSSSASALVINMLTARSSARPRAARSVADEVGAARITTDLVGVVPPGFGPCDFIGYRIQDDPRSPYQFMHLGALQGAEACARRARAPVRTRCLRAAHRRSPFVSQGRALPRPSRRVLRKPRTTRALPGAKEDDPVLHVAQRAPPRLRGHSAPVRAHIRPPTPARRARPCSSSSRPRACAGSRLTCSCRRDPPDHERPPACAARALVYVRRPNQPINELPIIVFVVPPPEPGEDLAVLFLRCVPLCTNLGLWARNGTPSVGRRLPEDWNARAPARDRTPPALPALHAPGLRERGAT